MKISISTLYQKNLLILLVIILLSILAYAAEYYIGESISQALVYHRILISQGEVWRLFTGHLLHTNGFHLLLNLSALVMLWALHNRFYTYINYTLLFLFCALSTSLGIFFSDPSLTQYVGLSGVLHGIFVFGAIMDILSKDKTGYLLFIAVWLKIAYEQIYGASAEVSSLIEANVAIDAHLWGAVGGLIFTGLYLLKLNNNAR